MVHYFDALGNPLVLGTQLGAGGEGTVFELSADERYVAKIYHEAASPDRADKLDVMVALASPELTAFASWPVKTVHEGRNGPLVGAVLPRVKGHVPIQNLYSPAHRKVRYPDKDWSFLLHVAVNCAAAFDSIHAKSHVIGDVNQGNLLVSAEGTVFFIDCDSFQICREGRVFPCEVGVAHFTPPELQAQSFRGVHRTSNHDNFGLAVLLFHLLFLGRHPYAGRYAGADAMPIERAIQEFRFAFGRNAAALQMAPPPGTLDIEQIAPSLAALFERAFSRGSERPGARPSARQWYDALKALRAQIRPCPADEGHRYASALKSCPWCLILKRHGLNFFASVTVYRLTTGAFGVTPEIERAWKQIEAIPPPVAEFPATLLPASPAPPPTPLPQRLEETRLLRNIVRAVAVTSLVLMLGTVPIESARYITAPIFLISFALWVPLSRYTLFAKEALRRQRRRWTHRAAMNRLKAEWETMAVHYGTQFEIQKMPLSDAYEQVKNLKTAYDEEFANLEKDKVNRQRARYLQGIFLSEARIEEIGEGLVAELASYGFETAYDVDLQRLQQCPHFSRAVVDRLVAWRRKTEAEFRYNAAQGLPEADLHALVQKFIRTRMEVERTLSRGAVELRGIAKGADWVLKDIERRYQEEKTAAAQAEADFRLVR